MRESEQKDIETFLELLGEFDPSCYEFTDVPDLLIRSTDKIIGVEHTRLYRDSPRLPSGRQLRPQERIHFQIAERARAAFRQHSSLPLYLTITFSEPSDYRTKDIPIIGDGLATAVLQTMTFLGKRAQPEVELRLEAWDFKRRGQSFPHGVASLHLKIHHDTSYELWAPSYGYMVPHLSAADIEETVERKEARINAYTSQCESVWLLMVTDMGMPSSHYDIPSSVTEHTYNTAFERLFLMTLFHRALVELRIQA